MDKDTREWLVEQHRDSYRYQLGQRNKIYDRVSFLSTPLTLLGAGIIYFFTNSPREWKGGGPLLFYIPISLAACCFVLALLLIIFCLTRGFRYAYALTPRELQDYATKLAEYAAADGGQTIDVLGKIKTNLAQQYCDAATHNAQVNYRRGNIIRSATKVSAVAFVLLLLSLPAFFSGKLNETTTPTRVIISEPVKIQ
jgi:hypothetical protein